MKYFFLIVISVSTLVSCTNNETNSKVADPDAVFFDYKIRGEEKDSNVTVYIQFKEGGPNGTPVVLDDPAKVELDGELISVDSAKLTGPYYEIRKPSLGFQGKHIISFTDEDAKKNDEEFVYRTFNLTTKLSDVSRGDLSFDFDGLNDEDYIRISATDTSFASKDINEIDTVKNGKLVIPAIKLKNLVNGPVTLLLSKETERIIRKRTEWGRIVVSYGIQREFELK
ncbi:MAG TPA: hypothetical protein VGG71_02005 [Chitinophagaceae bacterium]